MVCEEKSEGESSWNRWEDWSAAIRLWVRKDGKERKKEKVGDEANYFILDAHISGILIAIVIKTSIHAAT